LTKHSFAIEMKTLRRRVTEETVKTAGPWKTERTGYGRVSIQLLISASLKNVWCLFEARYGTFAIGKQPQNLELLQDLVSI